MSHENEVIQKTRDALRAAGWVYANGSLPGVYVQGTTIRTENTPKNWLVSQKQVIDMFREYCRDQTELEMIRKLFE